jgi:hypothetical protein
MREQARNLAQALDVFKMAAASTMIAASDGAARKSAPVSVARRGPNRAQNVARLPGKTKPQPKADRPPATAGSGGPAVKPARAPVLKTGTDDDWQEF